MAEPHVRPHESFTEFLSCVQTLAQQELFEVMRRGPDRDHLWMLGGPPTIREFKTSVGIEALREVWDRLPELRTTGRNEIQRALAARWTGQFPEDNSAIIANGIWSCVLLHCDRSVDIASRLPAPPQTEAAVLTRKALRWNEIDNTLVTLKLGELSEDIRKEIDADQRRAHFESLKKGNAAAYPSALLKLHERWTDEWARRAFDVYGDVLRIQGYAPSAALVREICAKGIVPLIRARTETVAFELNLFGIRTNYSNITAVLTDWRGRMGRAESRWTRRLAIYAKECEHADRVGSRVKSRPPAGWPGRPKDGPATGLRTQPTPERSTIGPSVANWNAIEISFISDFTIQIRIGTKIENCNYSEFGFEDRRNGKPNQAWVTLRDMAEAGGLIRNGSMGELLSKVQRRVQEIRKALRRHFGIVADPIPFVEGSGYQVRFKIGCSPSFRT